MTDVADVFGGIEVLEREMNPVGAVGKSQANPFVRFIAIRVGAFLIIVHGDERHLVATVGIQFTKVLVDTDNLPKIAPL